MDNLVMLLGVLVLGALAAAAVHDLRIPRDPWLAVEPWLTPRRVAIGAAGGWVLVVVPALLP